MRLLATTATTATTTTTTTTTTTISAAVGTTFIATSWSHQNSQD